jgi:glucose/arabinose dehydrogenase
MMFMGEGAYSQDSIDRQRGKAFVGLLRRASVLFIDQDGFRLDAGAFDHRAAAHFAGNHFDLSAFKPIHDPCRVFPSVLLYILPQPKTPVQCVGKIDQAGYVGMLLVVPGQRKSAHPGDEYTLVSIGLKFSRSESLYMQLRLMDLCFVCVMVFSATAMAQAPGTSPPPNPPAAQKEQPSAASQRSRFAPRYKVYATVEGQPIDPSSPEKSDDKPLFPEQTRAPYHATAPYKVATLTSALHAPWSMAFLPDGNILITEKLPGALRIFDRQGVLSEPLVGLTALTSDPETGLLDIALDPDFATNHRIFFTFFGYDHQVVSATNVARARLDNNTLSDVKVIFRSTPAKPNGTDLAAGTKTGGRIAIAGDGSLFVAIGDRDAAGANPWDVAQKLDTDLGKVIHITPDGKPAPGNPFIDTPGPLPEIWSVGQRSQEGLAFDPETHRLWETEHGPRGGDELNIMEKGKNYGWPVITHGIDYSGAAVGSGLTAKDGMQQPVYYWDPVIAPSGLAFYQGSLFPEWKNSVFVGGLRGMLLDRLTLRDDKVVAEEALLTDLHSRIRDVRVGPDGAVYVLTDSGGAAIQDNTPATSKLLKLTPK